MPQAAVSPRRSPLCALLNAGDAFVFLHNKARPQLLAGAIAFVMIDPSSCSNTGAGNDDGCMQGGLGFFGVWVGGSSCATCRPSVPPHHAG